MTVTQLKSRFTIGGSDAASAAGIDPYRSRIMLWLEKTGRVERPETEAMRWGIRLQPLIELREREYVAWSLDPRPVGGDAPVDPERAWLTGQPDGMVESDDGDVLLEIKTVNQWAKREWNGEPPLAYVAQVQHYLHLTGLDRGLLAVLVGGQRLELTEIERNQRAIDRLLEREEEFYGFLVRDEPPPPDDSLSAREAVAAMFPEHVPARVMRLDGAQYRRLRELHARREQRDTIDAQVRGLENELKAAMGDAETAISPHDEPVIHWRTAATARMDMERFKAEQPAMWARIAQASGSDNAPSANASRLSRQRKPIPFLASTVALPKCGSRKQLGQSR